MDQDVVERNRRLQTDWYGEPLGDRMRRVIDALDLTQGGLAEVIGLSAPMMSQLISAQRAKISNPAVLARLVAVEELAADGTVSARELRDRLASIRADHPTTTVTATPAPVAAPAGDPAPTVQALLRALASAAEIEAAAGLLDERFPELAAFLRVYGNGRTAEARAHLARTLTPS